jgi:hypothetical protein
MLLAILAVTTSGCSLLGSKNIEIVSKPIEIEIMQPDLPRAVQLTAPKWYVVSEAKITNPCKMIEGVENPFAIPPLLFPSLFCVPP